jgi:hypothetical protein
MFRLVLVTVVTLVSGELGSRLFWFLRGGVPLTDPSRVLYSLYPDLRQIDKHQPRSDDRKFDVLFLGASTLHPDFGPVELMLKERLTRELRRPVRIYNLAEAGHMSQDSVLKYRAVGPVRFDLVVVYDNINETRANNCPPEVFQADYSHFGWYLSANAVAPSHGRARWALPMTCRFLVTVCQRLLWSERMVSRGDPRPDWLPYGQTVRSADSLRANLAEIHELAEAREEPLVLMKFASYFDPQYDRTKFKNLELDYCLHISPTDIWGPADQVRNAVAIHNQVIVETAQSHPEVVFVDQEAALEKTAVNFNDVCHFTSQGCELFVNTLVNELLRRGIVVPQSKQATETPAAETPPTATQGLETPGPE